LRYIDRQVFEESFEEFEEELFNIAVDNVELMGVCCCDGADGKGHFDFVFHEDLETLFMYALKDANFVQFEVLLLLNDIMLSMDVEYTLNTTPSVVVAEMPMSEEEKAFVKYVVQGVIRGDLDKKKAAVLAGYNPDSADVIGSLLYDQHKIQDAISRMLNDVANSIVI